MFDTANRNFDSAFRFVDTKDGQTAVIRQMSVMPIAFCAKVVLKMITSSLLSVVTSQQP